MCPSPLNLKINNQLISQFREYLELERHYSFYTVENYLRVINQFNNFLAKTSERNLADVDTPDVASFLAYLKTNSHLKRISQLNRLSALKTFYRYLRKKGKIQKNPCDGIGGLREEKSLPTLFSLQEINQFLTYLEDRFQEKPNFLRARDRALFEILYSSGLRVGEVVQLKTTDLNFYQKNKWLRYGAYAWLFQNAVLVVSVLFRDYYYIAHMGLAYKRIGVLVFFASSIKAGISQVRLGAPLAKGTPHFKAA